MLQATLASEIGFLPIQVQKATTTKPPLFLVLSNKEGLSNYMAVTTSGLWPKDGDEYTTDHESVYQIFNDQGMFISAVTCPQYHSLLAKELTDTSKANYNPLTALLSSGFINNEQFASIANEIAKGQATADGVKLNDNFDPVEFARKMLAAKANGGTTPLLPGVRPDSDSLTQPVTTTIDIEAT